MFAFKRKPPYRIGLALSGGGARGFAHAGALKALLEVGLKPDIVAGVSAGSVAAVLYTSGMEPEGIVDLFRQQSFTQLCELTTPTSGLMRMEGFCQLLRDNIPYKNLEDLPIPTVVGATDFDRGKPVAFATGDIVTAVSASCSMPIVFKPVEINGTRYVDGGVLHNLPAWTIRKLCRVLIGINCSPLTSGPSSKNNLLGVALRSYELMAKTNCANDLMMCDIAVHTDAIARYQVFNLKDIDKVYRSGYIETMRTLLSLGFRPRKRTVSLQ